MPTETFFRLPEEKRARILECAWEEFTRVPYTEASINRIIMHAKIPRGSFYQYFADKEDLFLCLIGTIRDRLVELFSKTLTRLKGDIFEMPAAILDSLVAASGTVEPEFARALALLRMNANMDLQQLFFECAEDGLCPQELFAYIDTTRLRVQDKSFTDYVFSLLVSTIVFAAGRILQHPEVLAIERERMLGRVEIIKRGAAAESEGGKEK